MTTVLSYLTPASPKRYQMLAVAITASLHFIWMTSVSFLLDVCLPVGPGDLEAFMSPFYLPGSWIVEYSIHVLPTKARPFLGWWFLVYGGGWVLMAIGALIAGIATVYLWKRCFHSYGVQHMLARLALVALWLAVIPVETVPLFDLLRELWHHVSRFSI